ncbi:putative 3-phenylpropionic acid transporter [Saliniradius amylolyticus]|uniref:Putative 3-phenylpropionic acid transporter n=1 Tax=Saliniradius amylolyticus TaxID=2183582 RepID=A0A2S2E462_9ALTE|nr:MFS transporter [Saliniradius amylolyticus]AWL12435.1 putative 3-phenylpropionic acid transporter [Saliniradius amylolyticus]
MRFSFTAGQPWLAVSYFLYFGTLGVLVPYLSLFLDGRGMSSETIGSLLAIITLARIAGPYLWANLADRSGKVLTILQLGSLVACLSFIVILFLYGFWPLALGFSAALLFWSAIMPQLEVITLNAVDGDSGGYTRIRLWGSIGFILLTILSGLLVDLFGTEAIMVSCVLIMAALFASSLKLTEPSAPEHHEVKGSLWQKLKQPLFIGFIAVACLQQIGLAPYNAFFTLYMKDIGYNGTQTGLLLSVGVLAEIGIFIIAGRVIGRLGIKRVMQLSLALTVLRWYVLAYHASVPELLIPSQLIHAASFGLTHACAIRFIHQYFGRQFQSRGQALYVSLATGLGAALGNYGAGSLWQQGTGASLTFEVAMAVVLLAFVIMSLLPRRRLDA